MSKKLIVTGASRGIGKAIATELAKDGWDIGFTYSASPEEKIDGILQTLRSFGVSAFAQRLDVSDAESIAPALDRLTDRLGGLDAFINNAGVTKYIPFLDATVDEFNSLMGIDYRGTYFCAQYAAKYMIAHETRGCIINIASVHSGINFPAASMYGPNKAAVAKLTQHIALELAPYGIRCNSVSPGLIIGPDHVMDPDRLAMMSSRIPAQRQGSPSEIAGIVRYLLSDAAEYVTGSDFVIDGGARLPALLDNHYSK